jgi:hypothetical protein
MQEDLMRAPIFRNLHEAGEYRQEIDGSTDMPGHDFPLRRVAGCRLGPAALVLLAVSLLATPAIAQTSPPPDAPKEKPVVVPPVTDQEAVKKPPEHADQDAITRPPKVEPQMRDKARRSRKDKDENDDQGRVRPPRQNEKNR